MYFVLQRVLQIQESTTTFSLSKIEVVLLIIIPMDKKELNEAYERRSQMEERMCEIIDFLNLPGV